MQLDAFSIDGLELLATDDFWFEDVDGLDEPDRRVASAPNPGADGGFVGSTLYGMRGISVTGALKGRGALGMAGARSALGAGCQFKRDSSGVRILKTIAFSLSDGREFSLQAEVVRFKAPNLGIGAVEFSISIVAEDPLLYELAELDSGALVRSSGGGLIVPFVSPAVAAGSSGGSGTATNAGNSDAPTVIEFMGPLSSPYVLNQTTGLFMQLDYDVPDGETVFVDTHDDTILNDGGGDLIDKKAAGADFFQLVSGANNIVFSTGNSSDTGHVLLKWHNASISL